MGFMCSSGGSCPKLMGTITHCSLKVDFCVNSVYV